MAYSKDTPLVDNGSSTQLLGRSVHGNIKDLVEQDVYLTKMVKEPKIDSKTGKVTWGKGVINAVKKNQSRIEVYTHTPKTRTQTAGAVSDPGVTSSIDIVLANAATQLHEKMIFMNTANNSIGYIDAIDGTTVSFMDLGGAFTVTEGDTLLLLGTGYEYGSSDPKFTLNTDDNHYNLMQIFRFPIETTLSAKDSDQEAGGNLFNRYKAYQITDGIRSVESAFIYGKRAASGNTTAMTQLGTSVPTTRGLWDMAQSSYDFGSSITFEKIFTGIPLNMDRSMSYNKTYMWLMSKNAHAQILNLMNDNAQTVRRDDGNIFKRWGIKADTMITTGPDLAMVPHDSFNWGDNTGDGLIIDPEDLQFCYKNGSPPKSKGGALGKDRNWNVLMGTESNSSDTQKDELFLEAGLLSLSGGYQIMQTTSMV